jgi:hypothetical protein
MLASLVLAGKIVSMYYFVLHLPKDPKLMPNNSERSAAPTCASVGDGCNFLAADIIGLFGAPFGG